MTKRTLWYITPILLLLMAGSCTGQSSAKDLSADAFERALNGGGLVQLVDVRSAGEYASGHLEDARLMDWSNGQLRQEMMELDKDSPVLLYCASGRRSDAAMQELEKAGFTDVKHLAGGIQAWVASGRPVTH